MLGRRRTMAKVPKLGASIARQPRDGCELDHQRHAPDHGGKEKRRAPAPDIAEIGSERGGADRRDRDAREDDRHGARHPVHRDEAQGDGRRERPEPAEARCRAPCARRAGAAGSRRSPARRFDSTRRRLRPHITERRSIRPVPMTMAGPAIGGDDGGRRHRLARRPVGNLQVARDAGEQAGRQELGRDKSEDAKRQRDDRGPSLRPRVAAQPARGGRRIDASRLSAMSVMIGFLGYGSAKLWLTIWRFHAKNAVMHDHSSKPTRCISGDPLTDMLRGLRLEGVRLRPMPPRRAMGIFRFPPQDAARFHFISQRGCWLRAPSGEWLELGAGDAVLLPRGAAHALASEPGLATPPFVRRECQKICDDVFDFAAGGAGASSLLFLGLDAFQPRRASPAVAHDAGRDAGQRAHGSRAGHPPSPRRHGARGCAPTGSAPAGIMARLADVLAASIIRSWVEHGCGDASGWIAAVRNKEVGRVLAAIHLQPDRDWSVEHWPESWARPARASPTSSRPSSARRRPDTSPR